MEAQDKTQVQAPAMEALGADQERTKVPDEVKDPEGFKNLIKFDIAEAFNKAKSFLQSLKHKYAKPSNDLALQEVLKDAFLMKWVIKTLVSIKKYSQAHLDGLVTIEAMLSIVEKHS